MCSPRREHWTVASAPLSQILPKKFQRSPIAPHYPNVSIKFQPTPFRHSRPPPIFFYATPTSGATRSPRRPAQNRPQHHRPLAQTRPALARRIPPLRAAAAAPRTQTPATAAWLPVRGFQALLVLPARLGCWGSPRQGSAGGSGGSGEEDGERGLRLPRWRHVLRGLARRARIDHGAWRRRRGWGRRGRRGGGWPGSPRGWRGGRRRAARRGRPRVGSSRRCAA
mmetsp:Transcript_8568/g.21306  ORF Transcript_8568/g.21306 Transcript_8568/m.21306 type:complete len:224 (-) Transcript_8568:445-1116(-)